MPPVHARRRKRSAARRRTASRAAATVEGHCGPGLGEPRPAERRPATRAGRAGRTHNRTTQRARTRRQAHGGCPHSTVRPTKCQGVGHRPFAQVRTALTKQHAQASRTCVAASVHALWLADGARGSAVARTDLLPTSWISCPSRVLYCTRNTTGMSGAALQWRGVGAARQRDAARRGACMSGTGVGGGAAPLRRRAERRSGRTRTCQAAETGTAARRPSGLARAQPAGCAARACRCGGQAGWPPAQAAGRYLPRWPCCPASWLHCHAMRCGCGAPAARPAPPRRPATQPPTGGRSRPWEAAAAGAECGL